MIKKSENASKANDLLLSFEDLSVEYDFKIFIKQLIYHCLFFFLLGHFSLLIIIPIEGFTYAYNMQFIGNHRLFYIQSITLFGTLVPFYFLIIQYSSKNSNFIDHHIQQEILFCILIGLIRLAIIAFRYGFSSEKIKKIRKEVRSNLFQQEYLITGWEKINPLYLKEEIDESIVRLKIDNDLFKFTHFSNANDDYIKTISNYEINDKYNAIEKNKILYINLVKDKLLIEAKRNKIIDKKKELNNNDKDELAKLNDNKSKRKSIYHRFLSQKPLKLKDDLIPLFLQKPQKYFKEIGFPGRIIFRHMILLFDDFNLNIFTKITYLVAFIQSIIPFIYRYYYDQKLFGKSGYEAYCIIWDFILLFLTFILTTRFLDTGARDYIRRLELMQSLDCMINLDKFSFKEEIFWYIPTMNIFHEENYYCWIKFRMLTLDVGKRFYKKIELYSSSFLFIYSFLFIFIFLNLITNSNWDILKKSVFFWLAIFNMIYICILLLRMTIIGAKVNDYVNVHINRLTYIKNNLFLITCRMECLQQLDYSVNFFFRRVKDYLTFDLEGKNFEGETLKTVIEKFHRIQKTIDVLIDLIRVEDYNNPITILSIKLHIRLLHKFYFIMSFAFMLIIGKYSLQKLFK